MADINVVRNLARTLSDEKLSADIAYFHDQVMNAEHPLSRLSHVPPLISLLEEYQSRSFTNWKTNTPEETNK